MKPQHCPKCLDQEKICSGFVRAGSYYRTSDRKSVQRYRCVICRFTVSRATFDPAIRQKKRQINHSLYKLLSGGYSLRRAARFFNVHRKTAERKLLFLGLVSEYKVRAGNLRKTKALVVEFDDLETFEHTKFKPLSVTLAVESKTRRILGIEVSRMPAKGLLAKKSREKYGYRMDERADGRDRFFRRLLPIVDENALFKSDSNPYYPRDLKLHFPKAKHETVSGIRGAVTGQGELKKTGFDPLFSVNHTCAMLRANVNRLFRRTWNTTKKPENLYVHLMIYAAYHNEQLIPQA